MTLVRYDLTVRKWRSVAHASRAYQRQASLLAILDVIRQPLIGLTSTSRLKRLDSQEFPRLLNLLDQDLNFQALLQMANKSLSSMDAHSVESFGNSIDHSGILSNKSNGGRRPDQFHSLSSICPRQLVVDSLDPPLAPSSTSVEYADNTAPTLRLPTPTPTGQVSCRDFSAGAFSGTDLDKLLHFSLSEVIGSQLSDGTVGDYNIWQSTRLEDSGVSERSPKWSPLLHIWQPRTRCYQMLPFFYNHRWQLAIFDTPEFTLCYYDTMGDRGTPMSTFILLQSWYDKTVVEEHSKTLDWRCERDIPTANTMDDSLVLTWWLARRFIYGKALTSASTEWKADKAEADRILSKNSQDADTSIFQQYLTVND